MKEYVKNIRLPGIGLRIIKSSIAVAICYLVNLLRGDAGMVFYSQLAALWCIQMYRSNTKKNAIQRTIGTAIGAAYGLVYLLLNSGNSHATFYTAISVSIFILLVLYTTVVFKKNQASYFSCVVFLSIVVNHIRDINPYYFVFNRFLDTMLGIGVGIAVNDINLNFKKDKDTLFISGVDGILVNNDDNMTAFSRVELNRMIESGLRFTIATMRTPASLIEPLKDINLKYPVIAMDGAVLYDLKKNTFLKAYIISKETSKNIMELIYQYKMNWYANVLIDEVLLILYDDTEDENNQKLVNELKVSPYRNYIKRPLNEDVNVIYFMILDNTQRAELFYDVLKKNGYEKEHKILIYPSDKYEGYSYIKIYNKNATKENMIMYMKEYTGIDKVVTIGTRIDHNDVIVKKDNFNEMVRKVRKMYESFI